jgi:hypothetical protein
MGHKGKGIPAYQIVLGQLRFVGDSQLLNQTTVSMSLGQYNVDTGRVFVVFPFPSRKCRFVPQILGLLFINQAIIRRYIIWANDRLVK